MFFNKLEETWPSGMRIPEYYSCFFLGVVLFFNYIVLLIVFRNEVGVTLPIHPKFTISGYVIYIAITYWTIIRPGKYLEFFNDLKSLPPAKKLFWSVFTVVYVIISLVLFVYFNSFYEPALGVPR